MISETIELIRWESESSDGILVSMRMAQQISLERFVALREALEEVSTVSESWQTIDRKFAAAIHALSFHLEGNAATLRQKDKLPTEIDEELPLIYELIDEIFGS